MFNGVDYQFWKTWLKIFIESINQGIWDVIVNEPYTPKHVDNKQVDKPWNLWAEEERRHAQYDCTIKNILNSSLNMDELFRVSQCKSAKDMWDVFEVTHERIFFFLHRLVS